MGETKTMHLIRSLWRSPINAIQRQKRYLDTKLLTFSGGKLHQKLEFAHEGDQSQDILLLKNIRLCEQSN